MFVELGQEGKVQLKCECGALLREDLDHGLFHCDACGLLFTVGEALAVTRDAMTELFQMKEFLADEARMHVAQIPQRVAV